MAASPIHFTEPVYCFITGASRGIGRTIAIHLARKSNQITFVLLARTSNDLNETKRLIESENKNATIFTIPLNLAEANQNDFTKIMNETFRNDHFKTCFIFHNAGQIGQVDKVIDLSDTSVWNDYLNLNVTSTTVLNAVFLTRALKEECRIFVVNITSLIGRKPFKYFSMYGCAKAARDIYFKTLAKEQADIVVLNYSPGMVETAMVQQLKTDINKKFHDSEIYEAANQPTKLSTDQTVGKMFEILIKNEFQSGDIVDYYD